VHAPGGVLLNDEDEISRGRVRVAGRRLRCLLKVSLASIRLEIGHRKIVSPRILDVNAKTFGY